MPPHRNPASSSSSRGGAAAAAAAPSSAGRTSKPSARSSSHPKPPSALEQALDTCLDASSYDNSDALTQAALAAPTELLTPRHMQQVIVMLRDPRSGAAWRAGFALLHLGVNSMDRLKQFAGECLLMAVGCRLSCVITVAACWLLLLQYATLSLYWRFPVLLLLYSNLYRYATWTSPTKSHCNLTCQTLDTSPSGFLSTTATPEILKALVGMLEPSEGAWSIFKLCIFIAYASADTPNAAAAIATFSPACAKILRLAAAAATGDYPAGMDRAAAQAMLKAAGSAHDSSLAIQACVSIESISCRLPVQQCKVLVQQCLDSLNKLLGSGTEQADLSPLRCWAVVAIAALAAGGKGMAAAMRKEGGQKLLRVLCRTLAADAATVAEACTSALMHISQHHPMEVGLALKAAPGALSRLLVQVGGEVRIMLWVQVQHSTSQCHPGGSQPTLNETFITLATCSPKSPGGGC